eukprot:GILK01004418.1.p1 GENE.GILK01004418.1~~GILK01004418.1.p1  ORF type:complete len:213 (+),score=10.51 GILK01004418.1:50-688(+)
MAHLYYDLRPQSKYKDNKSGMSREEWTDKISKTTTLYVGNLSFYTTEEQIHELFSKAGEIKRIVMGLDRNKKTPCGFCFVEYYTHEDAADAVHLISGLRLDDRPIRADWDIGFIEGRQFGRGLSGGQVRDEFRTEYDPGRGGWNKKEAEQGHTNGDREMRDSFRGQKRRQDDDDYRRSDYKRRAETDYRKESNPRFNRRTRDRYSDDEHDHR